MKPLSAFLTVFLANVATCLFVAFYQQTIGAELAACLIHSLASAILVAAFTKLTFRMTRPPAFSSPYIVLAVTLLYFNISTLKYFVHPVYTMFAQDPMQRLAGSLVVALCILLMIGLTALFTTRHDGQTVDESVLSRLFTSYKIVVALFICVPLYLIYVYFIWRFKAAGHFGQVDAANVSYVQMALRNLSLNDMTAVAFFAAIAVARYWFADDGSDDSGRGQGRGWTVAALRASGVAIGAALFALYINFAAGTFVASRPFLAALALAAAFVLLYARDGAWLGDEARAAVGPLRNHLFTAIFAAILLLFTLVLPAYPGRAYVLLATALLAVLTPTILLLENRALMAKAGNHAGLIAKAAGAALALPLLARKHGFVACIGMLALYFNLAVGFYSGIRHIIVFTALAATLAVMVYRRRFGLAIYQNVVAFLMPFLVIACGPITAAIKTLSKPMVQSLENNILLFTYRSDLSDFAWSMFLASPLNFGGFGIVKDQILLIIPRFILPMKQSLITNTWDHYLASLGWPPTDYCDYTDTYFSMGMGIFGIAGMFLIPLGIIAILGWMDRYFLGITLRKNLPPLALCMFTFTFLRIESDPVYYIGTCRDALLLALAYLFATVVIFRVYNDTPVPRRFRVRRARPSGTD
jgi:hypothetical protein